MFFLVKNYCGQREKLKGKKFPSWPLGCYGLDELSPCVPLKAARQNRRVTGPATSKTEREEERGGMADLPTRHQRGVGPFDIKITELRPYQTGDREKEGHVRLYRVFSCDWEDAKSV